MTKNYCFREFECGLSVEETAALCFKSLRTVKKWDKGKTIPKECKRLVRLSTGCRILETEDWWNFRIHLDKRELPTGQLVSPTEIIVWNSYTSNQIRIRAKNDY